MDQKRLLLAISISLAIMVLFQLVIAKFLPHPAPAPAVTLTQAQQTAGHRAIHHGRWPAPCHRRAATLRQHRAYRRGAR